MEYAAETSTFSGDDVVDALRRVKGVARHQGLNDGFLVVRKNQLLKGILIEDHFRNARDCELKP